MGILSILIVLRDADIVGVGHFIQYDGVASNPILISKEGDALPEGWYNLYVDEQYIVTESDLTH